MEGVQGRDQQPYTGRMSRRGSASSSYRGEEGAFPSGGNKPTPNIRSNAPDYGDNLKTVYVSNILASMPSDALLEAFRQFGK